MFKNFRIKFFCSYRPDVIILIGFLFTYAPGFSQTAQDVTVLSDSIVIQGTILIPELTDKMTVVLIIAGSGPTDRNGNNPQMINNGLKMLAEALADSGIASLRYDKRGVAASEYANMQESEMRFDDMIDDANQWVSLLANDDRFDQIVVLGHSEGSLVGMMASQNNNVDKYISVAGPGRPANDILLEQIKTNAPFFTIPAGNILDSLSSGHTVKSLPPALAEFFRPSVQPYLISWFKYNPVVEIAKLKQPVLIIQGSTDIQVPVSDAKKLAEANQHANLKIIEGMNHIFKEASADRAANIETYSKPDMQLIDDFAQEIIQFIKVKD